MPKETPQKTANASQQSEKGTVEEPDISKYDEMAGELCDFSDPMHAETCKQLMEGYEELADADSIRNLKRGLSKFKDATGIINDNSRIFEKLVTDLPVLREYKYIVYNEGKPVLEFVKSYGEEGTGIDKVKLLNQ